MGVFLSMPLLVGQDGFYLVHLNEQRDGRAHVYKFGRLAEQSPAQGLGPILLQVSEAD